MASRIALLLVVLSAGTFAFLLADFLEDADRVTSAATHWSPPAE